MSQLYTLLQQKVSRFPELTAIVEDETRWTYQALLSEIDRLAQGLTSLGIQPGEHIGLMLYNQKEFIVSFFALRKIGAVVVPINIQMLPQDIAYVISHAGLQRVIVNTELYTHIQGFPLNFVLIGPMPESHAANVISYDSLCETEPAEIALTCRDRQYRDGLFNLHLRNVRLPQGRDALRTQSYRQPGRLYSAGPL